MTPAQESKLEELKPGLEALPPIERSVENGVLRETRAFRGVTLDQALTYLENLGGERTGRTDIEGDGWKAHLSATKVPVGPSYRLTEVTITWVGDEAILESVIFRFRLKTFRAPG
ncbi:MULTISPECIES: hypothetical protein [Salinibaculum]|uniref:hypothetical protein n=1 Tax=Salinibaculum TaxID=2732368 RepID=UPI0030CBEC68